MKKAAVIGHFADGLEYLDGQTVKTKNITNALVKTFGVDEVLRFDTHGSIKTLLKAPFTVFRAFRKCQNVVMLPAHNGLRIFGRLLPLFRKFFKQRKIHYVVVGGWLSNFLESKKNLTKALGKFDGIYAETNTVKNALEAQGFKNVFVMPNCKELQILSEEELVYSEEEPYRLCTFSRVMKEKGIEDAVNAVKTMNERLGRTVYTLDIYGQVDPNQTEWFEALKADLPPHVNYGGCVPFDQSVEVLKNYFALLFPTRFYTEGVPGTIIDAYAAGVPVISARWESFADIVEENVTGLGYEFGNAKDLTEKLLYAQENAGDLDFMKIDCLEYSKKFLPEKVIEVLTERLA